MSRRILSILFLAASVLFAQFPKAYMADAWAGPMTLPPGEGADAQKLFILTPAGLAVDVQNNVYVSDEGLNRVIRITPSGAFSVFAGTGAYSSSTTARPATQTPLAAPRGLAMDRNGNLYIANQYGGLIVKVSPDGTAEPLAGGGTNTGDGFAPRQTRLNEPQELAVDGQGNVYFYEFRSFKVRKVPAGGGAIETYAGTGSEGSSEASGPAKQSKIGWIREMFVGADNHLYLLDAEGWMIRRVTPGGTMEFVFYVSEMPMKTKPAGWNPSAANGGWADADGTLWLALEGTPALVRCPARKDCEVVAGGGGNATFAQLQGFNGDGPATQRRLSKTGPMAKDSQGNFIFLDGPRVRMLTASGELRTLAGGNNAEARGDGGPNSKARIEGSRGIAIDAQNNIYASDIRHHIVWKFGADGTATIVAGTGTMGYSGDGGPARSAELNEPDQLAIDGAGNLYIADSRNYVVRRVTPQGVISTFAGRYRGRSEFCPSTQGAMPATQYCFGLPDFVAADAMGNVYVGEWTKVVRVSGGTATPLNAPANIAALAVDRDGNLYVAGGATGAESRIYRSNQGTGAFTVVAGAGAIGSSGDGGLATAALLSVGAIAFDANRNMIISDYTGRTLRAITSDGKIQTIAGGGTKWGTDGYGGPSTDLRLNVGQLVSGPNGRIFYSDPGFSTNVFSDVHVWVLEPAQIFRTAVLNAASYRGGAVAGGEIVTLFGLDIGPKTLALGEVANGKFKNEIASTRVLFDGVRAPIIYVSETAASVVVPYAVAGKTETEVWIEYQGVATNKLKLPVAVTNPGVFTIPPTGSGQAAMLHWPDYSVNSAANPLAREGVGMLFLTSGGEQGVDGELAQTTGSLPFPVTVRVGGVDAQVLYAGPAPTLIYGMLQINFIVPASVTPGDKVPLIVQMGTTWSQQKVTIAVK